MNKNEQTSLLIINCVVVGVVIHGFLVLMYYGKVVITPLPPFMGQGWLFYLHHN